MSVMLDSCKYFLVGTVHFFGVYLILKLLSCVGTSCANCLFSSLIHFAASLFISNLTFQFTKRKFLNENIDSHEKAVLITGCDSGFGHELAKRLDSTGFNVFASCLFPSGQGAQDLKDQCSSRLKVLELDVTKDESVKEAFDFVKNNLGPSKLWAVVNNAGIQKGFTSEFASIQDFKDTMEVNGFGMVRVTKAFLPLLKKSKGRVVNITSLNGEVAVPHNSPYCMSKFAAAGFSNCLRLELDVWGIRVIQIEPELFKTNITDVNLMEKRLISEYNSVDEETRNEYGEKYFNKIKTVIKYLMNTFTTPKIYKVIDDLESAVRSKYPAIVYKPCRNDFLLVLISLCELLPFRISDVLIKIGVYGLLMPKPIKS